MLHIFIYYSFHEEMWFGIAPFKICNLNTMVDADEIVFFVVLLLRLICRLFCRLICRPKSDADKIG